MHDVEEVQFQHWICVYREAWRILGDVVVVDALLKPNIQVQLERKFTTLVVGEESVI